MCGACASNLAPPAARAGLTSGHALTSFCRVSLRHRGCVLCESRCVQDKWVGRSKADNKVDVEWESDGTISAEFLTVMLQAKNEFVLLPRGIGILGWPPRQPFGVRAVGFDPLRPRVVLPGGVGRRSRRVPPR